MSDSTYMNRCLQLAEKGKGNVSPNPLVGSVIVYQNKIIGEGYHQVYGEAHAEVNAINSVQDKSLLNKSTLYVNLEPCAHFGKTPPCSDLIIKHKIPNVVIGCVDSYSEVAGKGIERLKQNGISVTLGVLEKESHKINKRFFTFHNKKRPYIILKWAQTQDGYIDKIRSDDEVGINWISQPETKTLTHKWRSEEDAILVGKNTILNDNPSLTTRSYTGSNPTRVVLGDRSGFESNSNIFNNDATTHFYSNNLEIILDDLQKKNIQSIIIEGGKTVIESFISKNLWDEARVITGNSNFKEGLTAPILKKTPEETYKYGIDLISIYIND